MMHRLLTIPELMESILQELADADLVAMACVSRHVSHLALRILWTSPVLNGSPLISMAGLFPDSVAHELRTSEDLNMRVSPASFARFDYYASLIHALNLWHHNQEAHISAVLWASRPGHWIFPALLGLHLGATGELVDTLKAYLSPSLTNLRLNHWILDDTILAENLDTIKGVLLTICQLPLIEMLDFTDTKYDECEDDGRLIQAFVSLAPQLRDFRSHTFSTVPRVFRALSRSTNLQTLFLDTSELKPSHTQVPEIVKGLNERFLHLGALRLQSDMDQADYILTNMGQSQITDLDLSIDGSLDLDQLQRLTPRLATTFPELRSLRCTSGSLMDDEDIPAVRLTEALHPLLPLAQLRRLVVSLTYRGTHVLRDEEIAEYFHAWPLLRVFTLESDPSDQSVPDDDENTDYALSLQALILARRHCPLLEDLVLPYLNTSTIPALDSALSASRDVFNLHLPRSHVHNHQQLKNFVRSLWAKATIRLDGCSHFQGLTMRA